MKKILCTTLAAILWGSTALAGGMTPASKVKRIEFWKSGNFKVYLEKGSQVNGMESCTQTDGSVAIAGSHPGSSDLLRLVTTAKLSGAEVGFWVNGCCIKHNQKTSPCIETVNLR